MPKRYIIAGGGTGGHIFPAIAIANALKKQDPQGHILFVGAKGKMEMEKVPQAGYEIRGLDIAGFNRSSLLKNISLPLKLVKSFLQVRNIINEYKPHAVIGVGGYSSFPVLRFAQAKSIPTFIHESNSFAGKSNILLGKKATRIFVATNGMDRFFPEEKIIITGNPVRPSIAKSAQISKEDAMKRFGLEEGKTTILAVGGSLGARSINEAIYTHLDALQQNQMQLIWQTGRTDASVWKEKTAGQPGIWVGDFIMDMEYAYAAADIVVSRAGAMAVAELCVVQKPVLFVPYPFAAEDHQTANAKKLADENAALVVKDSEAKEKMVPMLIDLSKDKNRQELLKNNIARHAVMDADRHVAEEIIKSL